MASVPQSLNLSNKIFSKEHEKSQTLIKTLYYLSISYCSLEYENSLYLCKSLQRWCFNLRGYIFHGGVLKQMGTGTKHPQTQCGLGGQLSFFPLIRSILIKCWTTRNSSTIKTYGSQMWADKGFLGSKTAESKMVATQGQKHIWSRAFWYVSNFAAVNRNALFKTAPYNLTREFPLFFNL